MVRLICFFIGLVVVLAAAPSWGLMVGGSGFQTAGDADVYLAPASGGVSFLSAGTLLGGATTFVIPVGPTPTPPPNMTPIPPTPTPGGPVVPEPGTIALVGMGILGIAAATRRRRS